MNFDRKTGTHSGEAAEDKTGFAEFPRIPDEGEAPPAQPAAGPQESAEKLYSPGAFPALDIAYPNHNMRGGAGVFSLDGRHDNIQYSGRQNQDKLVRRGQAGQQPRQAERPPAAAGAAGAGKEGDFAAGYGREQKSGAGYEPAWSEQAMADRRYADRDGQGGYGGSRNAGPHPSAPRPPEAYARSEADPRISPGGQAADFREDSFRGGLGGDSALQPAYFDPSDYDYNYDPAAEAEAEAARQAQAQQAEAGQQAGLYAGAYEQRDYAPPPAQNYAPQQESRQPVYAQPYSGGPEPQNYAAPQTDYASAYEEGYPPHAEAGGYYSGRDADYGYAAPASGAEYSAYPAEESSDYQPQAGNYASAPAGQDSAYAGDSHGGYAAQNGYAGEADYGRAPPPGGPRDDFYPGEEYAAQPQPASESYRQEDIAPPFNQPPYAGDDMPLAEDFGRLESDVSDMDRLAGPFPPMAGERPAAPQGFAPAGAAEPASRGHSRRRQPAAEPRGRAPEPEIFFPSQHDDGAADSAGSPAADVAGNFADAAYGDELYDWAPAPASAAAPQAQRAAAQQKPQKSRKLLYVIIAAVVVIAAAAGVYIKYGKSIAGSGEPVIIHKSESDYKVKAPAKSAGGNMQEQSVSEGVNGAAADSQKTLIDKTETPLETQKMEERLPFSNEQGKFDQSAVDSLVKTAVAQATPVHIVPSVKVDADRKITAASAAGEEVLIPAADAPAPAAAAETAARQPARAAEAVKPGPPKNTPPARIAAASAADGSGYFMQISSQPSKDAAEASIRAAKKHLNPAQAGKIIIVPATIGGKSYYRVRVPAGSRDEAASMCEEYKQSGGHCFIAH